MARRSRPPPGADPHIWDRRSFQLTLVLGVATILVGIGVAWFQAHSDAPTREERLIACRDRHDVTVQQDGVRQERDTEAAATEADVVKSCGWPPAPGAGKDGYSEIVVDSFVNPDAASVNEDAVVWTFVSPCTNIRVEWRAEGGGDGGVRFVVDTKTYLMGQMLNFDGEPDRIPAGLRSELSVPQQDELFILAGGHIYPHRIICAGA
jgi:hypothetical protein